MSRTSRALRSVTLGYVHMVASMIAGLWLTPFLLRHLGQRDFGLWAAAMPALVTLGLLDFGVVALLQRDVAFSLGAAAGAVERASDMPEIIGRTMRLVWLQLPVLVLAALVAFFSMPTRWNELRGPGMIVLSTIVVCFPLRVYHAVAAGLQDLEFLGKLNLAQWALGLVTSVAFVLLGYGLYALAISWACTQIVTNVVGFLRVRTRYATVLPPRLPRLDRVFVRERLGRGFWVILSQLAVTLLAGTDLIVIALLMGPSTVTPYAVTGKLIAILANIPQYLLASAQPALSELKTNAAERERLASICLALTQAVLLVSGALVAVIVALNPSFVAWWVGRDQFAGVLVTLLLCTNMLLRHWATSLTYTLFAFGHERRISLTVIADGVVTVLACVLLTHFFGVRGAAASGLFGVLFVSLPFNLAAVRAETGMTTKTHVMSLVPWGARALLVITCGVLYARAYSASLGLVRIVLVGSIAAASYALVMRPLALREPLGPYTRAQVAALRARFRGRSAQEKA